MRYAELCPESPIPRSVPPEIGQMASYQLFAERREHVLRHTNPEGYDDAAQAQRFQDVAAEIRTTGTFELTTDEITYAAARAWFTAAQCPGRLHHRNVVVRDARDAETPGQVADYLLRHLVTSFNGTGRNLQSMVSVFDKGVTIANPQLLQYAGYRTADGQGKGYVNNTALTDYLTKTFGWKGEDTDYDILPWVIKTPGHEPELFEVPREYNGKPTYREVPISDDDHPWLEGLQYYSTPAVSDMPLYAAGQRYPTAFSGWYVSEELVANFTLPGRINRLDQMVAAHMQARGIPPRFRRAAEAEVRTILNTAILDSYRRAGIQISDPLSMSEQYVRFEADVHAASGQAPPRNYAYVRPALDGHGSRVYHDIYPGTDVPIVPGDPYYLRPKNEHTVPQIFTPGFRMPQQRMGGQVCPVPHDMARSRK